MTSSANRGLGRAPSASQAGAAAAPRGSAFARRRTRQALLIWLFLAPSLAIFFLYRIVPLGWNAVLSVEYWSLFKPTRFAGFAHYQEMFVYDDVFWQSLWNTVLFIASAPVSIAIAMGLALLVNSRIGGREIYRTILFSSYPMMAVAVGIIWRWLYEEKVGLINFILLKIGLIDKAIPFLNSFQLALPAVIVAAIWQIVGFFMIILLTGLQNIPRNLYEAAAIDGAGPLQQFRRITLPLLRPSIFLCMVIGIINSFTSFDLVYVMTGGGPSHATELLITYIYRVAFGISKFDYAAAMTMVLFLFLLLLTWASNRASGGEAGAVDTTQ